MSYFLLKQGDTEYLIDLDEVDKYVRNGNTICVQTKGNYYEIFLEEVNADKLMDYLDEYY